MIKIDKSIPTHFLYPSNLFAEKKQHMVTTILGSCVAICLYNEKLKYGGINHYMLPLWNNNGLSTPRFGNIANQKLLEKMLRLGSHKNHLVAKVFGGANQMSSAMDIGGRNIEIALSFLEENKIKLVGKSVGGSVGRKIMFDTNSGSVLMKYVQKSINSK